ncbi:MAG: DUF4982 domain-containing protein [Eubacterium sp.]|nr:DUF4982 domain-containing protein [Eubacterium sp.]
MRKLINDGWIFSKYRSGTEYETVSDILKSGQPDITEDSPLLSPPAPVDIPHDWMIYDTGNLYQSSVGVYERTLLLDASKCNSVYFEGVYMRTTVYLNGEKIFFWPYGYTSFEVDLTPYQKDGENKLLVYVDYRCPNTRWYSGAGIFRDVYHLEKEAVHIPEGGVYFHTSKSTSDENTYIAVIDTEVVKKRIPGISDPDIKDSDIKDSDTKDSDIKKATVTHKLFYKENLIATSALDQEIYCEASINTQSLTVSSPKLWDTESPNLYRLETVVSCGDKTLDTYTQNVGFRTISFSPDEGFFLNGHNLKINGACMHHDLGALGAAFNKKAARRQLEKLKSIGINAVRTSHNPPAPGLMELADEMGILINSDAFDMWEMPKTENDYGVFFHDWCERDIESWIRRDRNHPSVIMWSCGNEIPDTNKPEAIEIAVRLQKAMRRNDPRHNAYTTIASNYVAWENAQKVQDVFELSGYNYLESIYDEHHEKFPHWCIYGSETASTVQSRGIYHFPKSNRLLTYEDMQCSSLDNCSTNWGAKNVVRFLTDHRDRAYCAGQFIWTGWDYIGEPTPYFSKNSFFGHIDTAGFLKDTAYIIKSAWVPCDTDPFVHISPYWDFNPGQMIDIDVYSNAPSITLFLNGEKLGEYSLDQKNAPDFAGHFKVPYVPGVLHAEAYDNTGRLKATDDTATPGNPVSVKLSAEYDHIIADGEDLQFVEITVVDPEGNEVRNARNRINITVSGPGRLLGLDNGDSTDYEQYKTLSRKLFSGKLIAIIASTREAGEITISAASPGLETAELKYTTVPGGSREGSSSDYCICEASLSDDEISFRQTDIPARKITMLCNSDLKTDSAPDSTYGVTLTPEHPTSEVTLVIEPENATYSDINVKAMTLDGIESNTVNITRNGNTVTLNAANDGDFRLFASINNDKEHPEVISEMEYHVEGFGVSALDPYGFIYGCQFAGSTEEALLSFRGSINFSRDNTVFFDNVDFGSFGSDDLVISLFSFRNDEPVEIWDGDPSEGQLLCSDTYSVPTEYNVLQEYTFKLNRRLSGIRKLSFRFANGLVFGGFRMIRAEKAYSLISAADHQMITGDSFEIQDSAVYNIGNNVDIEYTGMDFSKGVSSVIITGRAKNHPDHIHIRFFKDGEIIKQLVEFPQSDEICTMTFPIEGFLGKGNIHFIFLPGTCFDLESFRFCPS